MSKDSNPDQRMLNAEMGKFLQHLRHSRGVGRLEMAQHLGISYDALRSLERGIKSTSMDDLLKYSKAFNIHVADIVAIVEQKLINRRKRK